MVADNMLIKLNENLRRNSYLARSDPSDIARLESCTYICTNNKDDAGPNKNWVDTNVMKEKLTTMMLGCMKGKHMYIIPFVMGELGHKWSIYGVQISDSPYVTVNMSIMTTMGSAVWDYIMNNGATVVKCFHSVCCVHDGSISTTGTALSLKWPSNKNKYIVHFPETLEIISLSSNYGGNSILAKKCVALRIASYIGRKEGWLAEHMLLIGLTSPSGDTKYIAGCFPSFCGKTNLALIKTIFPDWKITTLGDDITWLRSEKGQLWSINPETGFFGVCSNTSYKTNPNCMETIKRDTIFTNVAL